MSTDDRDGDRFRVGYGKPPRWTQFKPGQSGNKKGRPSKTLPVTDRISAELRTKRTIEIDGKRVRVSMQDIIIKQLVQQAAKGNMKALLLLLEVMEVARRAEVKKRAQQQKPRHTAEQLKGMTGDQLNQLYIETLRQLNQSKEDDEI